MSTHPTVRDVTDRIRERSRTLRGTYLQRVDAAGQRQRGSDRLGCANVAHAVAGLPAADKLRIVAERDPNIAVVTAYNDMLSAHAPYRGYPDIIKDEARRLRATAQVAGGVAAMCDGVTQGTPGMELSLFSRDTIAMSTAVALSHDMFDAALLLGVCDKIVPGLLIGALHFGHLPTVFVPAGPMPSGISNSAKAKVREQAAQGRVGRAELLDSEMAAYHAPGTCTFYGTANSNQMLLEAMGLHVPGTAFIQPGDATREALTREAVRTVLGRGTAIAAGAEAAAAFAGSPADRAPPQTKPAGLDAGGWKCPPIGHLVDERAIVNAMAALLATGGSTNHLIHWVAVARSAGLLIDWNDFAALSEVVPLLTRVYPNGSADVNQFQAAGGPGAVIGELLDAGLMHADVATVRAGGLREYANIPALGDGTAAAGPDALRWTPARPSKDETIVRTAASPFSATGGLKLLTGNLGRSVIKVSSVPEDRHIIEAPARVFDAQDELQRAFMAGELDRDVVCVVRWQGPQANGMPELHKLTPPLAVLQGRGFRVALVTDGRMSGASGKVPAAIHVSPEAADGGPLARVRDGDIVRLDSIAGTLDVRVLEDEWAERETLAMPEALRLADSFGLGRELFAGMRRNALTAEQGACTWL